MLKDQIEKYENTRKLFSDPYRAVISNKAERERGLQSFSLHFPIGRSLSMKIMDIARELRKKDPGHEYVSSPMFHCTIKSFGLELFPEITERLEAILKNFPSFTVELRGTNHLRPIAFIQVFSRDDKLLKLHNLLNGAMPYSMYPELEGAGYVPHVTIAYFYHKPDKLFSAVNKYKDIYIGRMKVERLNLIKGSSSQLGRIKLIKSFKLK